MAWLLDDLVRIPGTGIGIGVDAVLGLVPGIGDASATLLGSVIMVDALRHRLPLPVLARMGLNLVTDALLGLIPGVGDVADIVHRACRRNFALLQDALADQETTRRVSLGYLIAAAGIVVATLAVVIVGMVITCWALGKLLALW